MRKINKVILHCSDTIEGAHIDVDTIRKWHTSEPRNWSDIGYHYVIYLDGTIAKGRDIDVVGAHCRGNNKDSIGICYIGGVNAMREHTDTMTAAQDMAFIELWHALQTVLGDLELYGHNDFSNKACPCFKVQEKYKFLIEK